MRTSPNRADHLRTTSKLLRKPAYADPCNGCGMCCVAVQCPISTALFGTRDLCPALEQEGRGFACGLVRNTADYVPDMPAWGGAALTEAFGLMLGAGAGCDGEAEGEEVSVIQRWRVKDAAREALKRASPEARELVGYFQAKDAA